MRANGDGGLYVPAFEGNTRETTEESKTAPAAEFKAMRDSLLSARSAKDQYQHSQSLFHPHNENP